MPNDNANDNMTIECDHSSSTIDSKQPEQIQASALRSVEDILTISLQALDANKAEDILAIDLRSHFALSDYMIIASAQSNRHVIALADHILTNLKKYKAAKAAIEGLEHGEWILIDVGDVIIHLFRQEVREFYNIEKMWLGEDNAIEIAPYLDREIGRSKL